MIAEPVPRVAEQRRRRVRTAERRVLAHIDPGPVRVAPCNDRHRHPRLKASCGASFLDLTDAIVAHEGPSATGPRSRTRRPGRLAMDRFRRASVHAGFRPTAGQRAILPRPPAGPAPPRDRPARRGAGAGAERTAARLGPASSPAWTKRCRRPVLARMERTHRRVGQVIHSQSRLPGRHRRGSEFPKGITKKG